MEASSVRRRVGGGWPGNSFSGRRGTALIAIGAAIIAGLLIFLFVQQYKKNVNGTVSTSPVFVATQFIHQGTSADLIATDQLFQRTLVKSNQVVAGAITDSSALQGAVAATNIYPGQQLTAGDFTRTGVTIGSDLSGSERAMAIPVDDAHGMVNYVHAGDYVDLLESFAGGVGGGTGGAVTVLDQNVLVLATASAGGGITGGSGGNEVIVRVPDKVALAVAYASDNGKVWVTLRPPTGATDSARNSASAAVSSGGGHTGARSHR